MPGQCSSILFLFLGTKAPLEIAMVGKSLSQSAKSLEIAVNALSEVSGGTKRYFKVSRCIESYQVISSGINRYQEVAEGIKCIISRTSKV